MSTSLYALDHVGSIPSPALVFHQDIIVENIRQTIEIAGGTHRLWPHVKTHKCADIVRLQMAMGIERFKCATIAEAEMVARCGAPHILVAYPLIGPAIDRFVNLVQAYPQSCFWAIGDSEGQLAQLGLRAAERGLCIPVLADVDVGMHRTGVSLERLESFYARCAECEGLHMQGFHAYDGHVHDDDPAARKAIVDQNTAAVQAVQSALVARGIACPVIVAGGSPTFPFHAQHAGVYVSPGTVTLWDASSVAHLADIALVPAAVLLTRVISHPGPHLFTLDLGNKAIAADPVGARGVIAGMEDAEPVSQSEEHWVFRTTGAVPAIGTVLYVIPTHVCPTSALYPQALVAARGRIVNRWEITARNRCLTL